MTAMLINVMSTIGVVTALMLVILSVVYFSNERGFHPLRRNVQRFREFTWFEKLFFSAFVGAMTIFASLKDNPTNSPPSGLRSGGLVENYSTPLRSDSNNDWSLDCDRVSAIDVSTNGVSLTLHRPETNALDTVEVTVAGSTNLVAATWEAYTNVVFAAGETNVEVFISCEMMSAHLVSNVNFFAFIQSGDSDDDGLPDWHERFNLKTDPYSADTDGDGIPDGLDHRPLEGDWPVSTDDGHLVCWTMWNTNAVPVVGTVGEVVYERTFAVSRTSRWQQYFLSSADDDGAGWPLVGATIEWRDSSGGSGTITTPSVGDSLCISLSPVADTITIALRVTDPTTFAVPSQLHLLGYAPEVTVGGIEVSDSSDYPDFDRYHVFTDGAQSEIPIYVDRSHRPCGSALSEEETNVAALAVADFRQDVNVTINAGDVVYVADPNLDGGGFLSIGRTGTFQVPGGPVPGAKLEARELLILDPAVVCPADGGTSAPRLAWDAATGSHSQIDEYPLDTLCLRRNWRRSSDGEWGGDHDPEVTAGVDTNEFDFVTYTGIGSGTCCTGKVFVCGTEVWSREIEHRHVSSQVEDFTDPLSDECGCCSGGCADGDCSALERPEADTALRFRIPFGMPRKDQVSGFLYFTATGAVQISKSLLQTKMRDDATLVESSAGGVDTFACSDERGRAMEVESIAEGVRIAVRTQSTQALEHIWEVTNVGGSTSQVRFHQISRLGNTMLDLTFTYDDDTGSWTKADAVSGLAETVETTGDLNDSDCGNSIVKTTARSQGGVPLTRTIVTSMRIGNGGNAVLRETQKVEQGWDSAQGEWHEVSRREADYWNDASTKRHGKLRLLSGTGCAWEYHDFDNDGREILRVEQRNGAAVPGGFPYLDANGALQNVCALGDAFVTVFGYTPMVDDDEADSDIDLPRVESRYAVKNGAATLIARTWRRYTHLVVSGFSAVKCETWRAAAQNAQFGDVGNAYSYTTTFDDNVSGVSLVVRGERAESLNEDGILTTRACSQQNGRVVFTERKFKDGNEFQTYAVTELDTTHGNTMRTATYVTADAANFENDVLIEEEINLYDEKNRLRSTTYLDGTFITNHYSCCRLLDSTDREGRTTLRSAVTGEDHLYYAEEDVYIGEISYGGYHRITQHFLDALGRETNTVVYAGSTPGEAVLTLQQLLSSQSQSQSSQSSQKSQTTTAYPRGTDAFSIRVDERGKTTTTETIHAINQMVTREVVSTNGVDVVTNETIAVRGGATIRRTGWNGGWNSTRSEVDYDAGGCRLVREIRDSSDIHGSAAQEFVAETSAYDFLGRLVSTARPGANGGTVSTTVAYDGVSSRRVSSSTTGSPTVAYSYNARGELNTTVRDGTEQTVSTTYEWNDEDGELYKVERTERAVPAMLADPVASMETRTQLTGLSVGGVRSRRVTIGEDGHETVEQRYAVPWSMVSDMQEYSRQVDAGTPDTTYGIKGFTQDSSGLDGAKHWSYDAMGRKTFVIEDDWMCGDLCLAYTYNGAGDMTGFSRWESQLSQIASLTTSMEYDALGNETARNEVSYHNCLTSVTNTYDSLGRVIAVNGDTYPICTGYSSFGAKVASRTTRNGGASWDETRWERDPVTGLVTNKVYADGSRIGYTYTVDGKPARTTWARGAWREYAYDNRGLQSGIAYSDNSTPSVSCAYNAAALPTTITVGDEIQTGYTFDERLLCTNEVMSIGAVSFSLTRSFDSFRRVETTAAEYGSQLAKNTRIYDSENRVSGYVLGEDGPDGHSLAVEIGYQGHCPTGIVYTLPNNGGTFNVLLSRQPGHRDWVTERRYFMNDNITNPLYLHQTTYDCKGRPTSTTDSLAATRQWLYNRRSELIGTSSTSVIPYSYTYAYDSIGNRLSAAENSISTTYAANNLNQYTAILRGSASPCEPTYDADGNLTQDERYVYTYDCENRLMSVMPINPVYGDCSVENIYDHRNRRIRKIVRQYDGNSWNEHDTHTCIWDGWNIVTEHVSNADTTTHTIEYFWGNDLSGTEQGAGGVGGLLAVRIDGIFHIPVYDNNGNIVMYAAETGAISAQYIYDPYGNIVQSTGPSASQLSFGFSTKYHDREVDLIPYQLRVYNPVHGRWLSRDPIEEFGGMNLYVFCEGNSILNSDVLGCGVFNYVPFISTAISMIDNYLGHVPGSSIVDYSVVSPRNCKCNIEAAEADCIMKIDKEALKYVGDYSTDAMVARVVDLATTFATIPFGYHVAGVVFVDGMIATGLNIQAASRIMNAANEAKNNNCSCSQYGY